MELNRSRKKVLIKRIIGYLLLFFIPILLTATIIYFYDNLSSKSNIEEKSKQKINKLFKLAPKRISQCHLIRVRLACITHKHKSFTKNNK